jgi:hypothetical protein
MEYQRNKIYKSTLVSQLNANPFLSKDRLRRVKKSLYFNNSDAYLIATSSSSTCLLGLGSDCGVYLVQNDNNQVGSKRRSGKNSKAKKPIHTHYKKS